MQQSISSAVAEPGRVPEARYSYYRRCQVFRRNGEQCKAPAETGSLICHAHAGQLAMAVRREKERRVVLEEAVAEMRRRGRPEFEAKDLFMDFKGINMTLAVMAQALIDGRIDCKTAGRMVVQLQTFSKLLWQAHRKGRKENRILPQICADARRLGKEKASTTKDTKEHEGPKDLPLINTDNTDLRKSAGNPSFTMKARRHGERPNAEKAWAASHLIMNRLIENQGEELRIGLLAEVVAFADIRRWPHGPPGWVRAA